MSDSLILLGGLSGWKITGIVVGVLFVVVLLVSAKDIIRYIKISSM
jgi:hypothetical protein